MALPTMTSSKYKVTIPSTGETVDYRPYLVKEEKILMIALESQDQKQILTAIQNVIGECIDQDIDVDSLAMFDIEALFLALRSKSVGERIELMAACSKCENKTEIEVLLDDVKCAEFDKGSRVIELSSDVGVTMNFPSPVVMNSFKEGELESIEGVLKLIAMSIESIYDESNVYPAGDETEKSLSAFIESLNNSQLTKITDFFEDMPSLEHTVEFKCSACDTDNTLELKGLQAFFT